MRRSRDIPEREIALALVLELAESGKSNFSLLGYYDNDIDFVDDLVRRLDVEDGQPFRDKLTRVVRKLVRHSVLYGLMKSTQKEYFSEPTKQMEYGFSSPGKHRLLTMGKTEHTGSPEWEAGFLIRRAYPAPE